MKYSRKPKCVNYISIMLIVGVAVLLGACSSNNQDQDITYKSEKYGISVNIPKEFADATQIKEDQGVIYFVNKEIQEANPGNIFGIVGRIEIYDKKDFTMENIKEKEDIYSLRFLDENENYYFGWAHATDVQIPSNATDQLKDKFRAMEAEFDEIIKTVVINESK